MKKLGYRELCPTHPGPNVEPLIEVDEHRRTTGNERKALGPEALDIVDMPLQYAGIGYVAEWRHRRVQERHGEREQFPSTRYARERTARRSCRGRHERIHRDLDVHEIRGKKISKAHDPGLFHFQLQAAIAGREVDEANVEIARENPDCAA